MQNKNNWIKDFKEITKNGESFAVCGLGLDSYVLKEFKKLVKLGAIIEIIELGKINLLLPT